MLMRYLISALVALVPMAVGYGVWQFLAKPRAADSLWIAPTDGQARLEGKRLYDTYCASCHGISLQGQANWRQRMDNGRLPAPPHDFSGHTWHHPDIQLIEMIKIGFVGGVNAPKGYQSDMPAFGSVLSDEQIRLVLGYIKSAWPDDALEAQREISLKQ
ncbi:MAG: cytochrome c [Burkholderiaceae bacterium]|nr:cytochrome c [Burkholderiaceae bacterium]MCD8516299.1 cytochrome c [Burkholderiaceae bacterium]MCD8537150.1 cytochrome c [Burkholderiaceae bacterium]MCD8566298.1 cytochrome c [Burkholderiaceae bacterium]